MVTTGENMRTMKRSPGRISSGSLEHQAHVFARSRRNRIGALEPADFGFHFGGARVKMHRRAMLAAAWPMAANRIRSRSGWWRESGRPQPATMPRASSEASTPAMFKAVRWPGGGLLDVGAMHLNATHTDALARRMQLDFLIDVRPSRRPACR